VVGVDLVWSLVRDDVEVVAGRDVVSWCVPAVRDDLGVESSSRSAWSMKSEFRPHIRRTSRRGIFNVVASSLVSAVS